MKRRRGPPEVVALMTHWRRWTDIVDLFARRRPARRRVGSQEYAVLHKALIQDCRTLAESAGEEEAAYYRQLEDLVQPWLNPSILARADREILMDLLIRCRQVEYQLGGRPWTRTASGWAPMAVLASLFAVGLVLGIAALGGLGSSALELLRGWSTEVWIAVRRSSDIQRLSFIGLVLIIVSIVVVSRTARS
jgi:hypothetical protein